VYDKNGRQTDRQTSEICKMLGRTERKKLLRGTRNGWKDNIKVDLEDMW
jgi:hypothetical protein